MMYRIEQCNNYMFMCWLLTLLLRACIWDYAIWRH